MMKSSVKDLCIVKILAAIQNFLKHWTYCFSKENENLWMPVQISEPRTLYNVSISL